MGKAWPALEIRAGAFDDANESIAAAILDDYSLAAIEDLSEVLLPAGGLWDPTFPPIPELPPAPIHWRVFFHNDADRQLAAAALAAAFPRLTVTEVDIEDEDWAARSQRELTAVRAGNFLVAPPWDLPTLVDADVTVVVIEPSMGFGTGHHQTTRLCLRLLSTVELKDRVVLDLGTGSGVLGMAAALRGARSVCAVDVDADAIASAEASARLNPPMRNLRFQIADFRTMQLEDADVVVANLTGGMLTSAARSIEALVRPGGQLIVSGFDRNEAPGVREAFAGFTEDSELGEDEWVALSLRR